MRVTFQSATWVLALASALSSCGPAVFDTAGLNTSCTTVDDCVFVAPGPCGSCQTLAISRDASAEAARRSAAIAWQCVGHIDCNAQNLHLECISNTCVAVEGQLADGGSP